MSYVKIFHTIIFIFAFFYLVFCPAVHDFGETIRHDVICKNGEKVIKNHFRDYSHPPSSAVLKTNPIDMFTYSKFPTNNISTVPCANKSLTLTFCLQ